MNSIAIRLNPELQEALDRAARRESMSRSEFVRECIEDCLVRKEQGTTAWELGKKVFGKYTSGRNDLSENRKEILREKLLLEKNPMEHMGRDNTKRRTCHR